MSREFSTKKWFTLIEIVIMTIIISVWLLAVINGLNSWIWQVQKLNQRTIATYLAKEWIEAVYNIRETNLKNLWLCPEYFSWYEENKRLQLNPGECPGIIWLPGLTYRMNSWSYYLSSKIISWQSYFILNWVKEWLNLSGWINTGDLNFSLCEFSWTRQACPWEQPQSSQWKFFRSLEWKWLFLKNSIQTWWEFIDCSMLTDTNCKINSAKEFRFCSRVEYIGKPNWNVEFCGIITN